MHLIPPDAFQGIGGSIYATHAGYLPCLPSTNYLNVAYYAPKFPQTLLSLGQLHACGGGYATSNNPNKLSIYAISSDPLSLIDTPTLTPGSNLLPTSVSTLAASLSENPSLTQQQSQPPPSSFPTALRKFIAQHPPNPTMRHKALLAPLVLANTEALPAVDSVPHADKVGADVIESNLIRPFSMRKPTVAQQQLALAALDLHEATGHPPDAKLCHDVATGKHPYSSVTPAAIHLMRQIVGPCPHCLEGRANRTSAIQPPSTSPPTTNPGQVISYDPQKLPCPVLGGFTHKITMVDKHTGFTSQPGSTSKSTKPVLDAIVGVINKQYNANGFHVDAMHGDAENINISLRPHLGTLGTKVLASLPGQHAQCAERTTQTIQDRARAVTAGLPYYHPPEINLLLDQAVGECLNHTTNKSSTPLTPYEALYGLKLKHPPVPFGRCAMVLQPDDKRNRISIATGIPFKKVPVTELGVSMGLQPGTDYTQFLLANGRVVPRRPIGPIFPRNFVPFGWKPKPAIYNGQAKIDLPASYDIFFCIKSLFRLQ